MCNYESPVPDRAKCKTLRRIDASIKRARQMCIIGERETLLVVLSDLGDEFNDAADTIRQLLRMPRQHAEMAEPQGCTK